MKLGICIPHYGRPIEVERLLAVVRHAEEAGLDSVWVTDHVIVPHDVDVIYREHMLDPLAVLPWLAAATERVSLGTSVVILPYRTPIPVAKLLASVDVLSGGRLIVGVAIGWMEGEFAALGVPFKERVSRSEEAITLMKTLWTDESPKLDTAPSPPLGSAGVADAAAQAAPADLGGRHERRRAPPRRALRRRLARDGRDAGDVPPGQAGGDEVLEGRRADRRPGVVEPPRALHRRRARVGRGREVPARPPPREGHAQAGRRDSSSSTSASAWTTSRSRCPTPPTPRSWRRSTSSRKW